MLLVKNEEAVNQLIDDYGDSILRICYLLLKDYQLAEDALQETFLAVYKNYGKFQNRSTIKTWIMRIAINQCKSIMRKNYYKFEREQLDIDRLAESVVGSNDDSEDSFVSEAVMSLPIKEREVILAYYYEELSVKEVANTLGIKDAAVMQRLKRGRDKLNQILKGRVVI